MQAWDPENHNKTLLRKKFKYLFKKQRDISSSWIGRCNIVKMEIIPKVIFRFYSVKTLRNIFFFL